MKAISTKHISFVTAFLAMLVVISSPLASFAGSENQIFAKINVFPNRVVAGGSGTVSVSVHDMFVNPVAGANVKIWAETGAFEPSMGNDQIGRTDENGSYVARWNTEKWGTIGIVDFSVQVSKPGYGSWSAQTQAIIEYNRR